nr:retrovirus-related Pol polyprotein from transposon TNT 1-94 [Tanacetum cinerariifolium]
MAFKQFSLEPGLSNLNEREKSLNPSVSKVSETSKKDLEDLFQDFYDEYFDSSKIMKSLTTNVETSINEEVFHESILNNMIPNGDEASTSRNVFNELLEDAYFDMDVKTTFLNGILKEEVYVGQPLGFVSKQYPDHVYALDKALYVPTPMVEQAKLKLDLVGKPVDHTDYRSMIRSLISKSTSGGVQFLGDKLVCWSSKKQNCVSISTAESEYVAVSSCCAQVLWMRTQLTDYGFFYDKVPIYCDSKSAIAISYNRVQHTRTKHIDVRYHFIKDHVEKGTIELYFVGTEYQLADLFTKSLPEARFKFLVEKLGMMSRET